MSPGYYDNNRQWPPKQEMHASGNVTDSIEISTTDHSQLEEAVRLQAIGNLV